METTTRHVTPYNSRVKRNNRKSGSVEYRDTDTHPGTGGVPDGFVLIGLQQMQTLDFRTISPAESKRPSCRQIPFVATSETRRFVDET